VPEPSPFPLTDREAELVEKARVLAADFAADAARVDRESVVPVEALTRLHDEGFDGAFLPRALGGEGLSYQAFGAIVRVVAAADPSVATIWVMHVGSGVGLATLTADTLGSYYADAFLAGERFANALSEPASGNRFFNPQQEAEPVEGGWVLDGAKRFVSGSELAQHLLVNVLVDGVPTFFGVEPDESVQIIPIWDTLGYRGTRSQLLSFNRTLLRADRRGRGIQPGDFNAVGAGLPGISLGVADAAFGALAEHARSRQILGAPLSHQQWVQFEGAEAHIRIEAAGALYRQALAESDLGLPSSLSSLDKAKFLANKTATEVAQLGVRVGGASGFLSTSPIQRHFRDAQAGQLMAYSTEVLAGIIGKQVLGVEEGA